MQLDYIIQGIIFSKISSLNFELHLIIPIMLIFFLIKNETVQDYISEKISKFYEDKTKSSIHFRQLEKARSTNKFKALMHYLSINPNPTIRKLAENVEFRWDRNEEDDVEKFCGYRVDQEDFEFNNEILGKFWISNETENRGRDDKRVKEYWNLEVYSYKLKTRQIIRWIDDRVNEYRDYIKTRTYQNQIILNVGYDAKESMLITEHENWKSNVTFENRFFDNKDKILNKINFFLNNKDWYISKGIPYTLGFLLYGKPGCGKTSFIKAILNMTKRHCINVKLTDDFDLDMLREVIQKEQIEDYIIPNKNRILVFEDIDCMGNMVKKRKDSFEEDNIIDSDEEIYQDLTSTEKVKLKKIINLKNKDKSSGKNNLSYFLNILDGLIECDGRIIIMTTNKPNMLDPALIRPGRIDEKIEFKELGKEDFVNIINKFYSLDKHEKSKFKIFVEKNLDQIDRKYTPAELINLCRGIEKLEDIKKYFNLKN